MNTTELQIGKASYGRTGGGHGWFYIEDNKDNVFRVLPPMKSLAQVGKYAQYYRTHRGFRGSDGKQRPFLCVEEFNFKQKLITKHCPICDIVANLEAEVATFKGKGATDEQIREYRNKNIFPFQAEGKYYLNVINPEGKVGILAVGSKMFKSLEMLAMEQEKKGRDITGMEGVFLNFKKQTTFKGDKNAVHKVDLYLYEDAAGPRYVPHVINNDNAAKIVQDAADLSKLFKELNVDQISQLCALQGDDRAKYIDGLFAAPAPAAPAQVTTLVGDANSGNFSSSQVTQPAQGGFTPPAGFGGTQSTPAMAPSQPATPPAGFGGTSAPAGFTPPAGFGGAPVQSAPATAPAAPAAAPAGFTPPAGFAAPSQPAAPAAAPTGFTPPAGFGGSPAPAAGGTPLALANDKDFLNMVRPKKG